MREVDVDKTLNSFLRSVLHLTGTKRMCLEGGCGACIVAVERKSNVLKKATVQAVNSCLVPLMQCNGWKIETIEGISHSDTDYHFLQKVLTHFNGSQCGFCSPGMVMNMYSLSQDKKITMKEVENSFGGNICRCTGYRPILSAFKAACNDASSDLLQQCPDIEDLKMCQKRRERPHNNNVTCQNPYYFNLGKTTWIKVFLLNDLLQILKTFQNSTYTLVAGNTSIGECRLVSIVLFLL
jgi:xanthine dehydrogenase/oxidase